MHILSCLSYHIEDFLIYVSALGAWMTLTLYLPHFHGPLVNMAFRRVASLHSCLSFLHPTSLTGIENELQLIRLCGGGQILHPKLSSSLGKQCAAGKCSLSWRWSHLLFLLVIFVSSPQPISPDWVTRSPSRHHLWVNKSGFQNCIFTNLISIDIMLSSSLIPFLGCLLACICHIQKLTAAPGFDARDQSLDKHLYLYSLTVPAAMYWAITTCQTMG